MAVSIRKIISRLQTNCWSEVEIWGSKTRWVSFGCWASRWCGKAVESVLTYNLKV